MNHYLDIITRNHELNEFSSPSTPTYEQKGGEKNNNKKELLKTTPTGCFPPIYKIKPEDLEKNKIIDKSRAFAQVKTALSIKDIMENRRDKDSQSFIAL